MSACDQGHVGGPGERQCAVCGHQLYEACANGHWMPVGQLLCQTCQARPATEAPPPAADLAAPMPPPHRPIWTIVAIATVVVVLAAVGIIVAVTTGSGGGSKPKLAAPTPSPTTRAPTPASTTPTTVAPPSTPTTLPAASVSALPGLTARPAPPVSPQCTLTPGVTPPAGPPAQGNGVATLPAPNPLPFPQLTGSSPHYTKFTAAPPFCIDVHRTYLATMKTDVGTVVFQLFPSVAPVTVNNFVFLAGYHFYDGTVFHRVIQGFVDQGGDPTGTGEGGPG